MVIMLRPWILPVACGLKGAIKEQQDWADGCFWRGFCPRWGVPGFDRSVGPCKARLGPPGVTLISWRLNGAHGSRSSEERISVQDWSRVLMIKHMLSWEHWLFEGGVKQRQKRGEVNMRMPYCHISADLMWHLYFCLHLGCLPAYSRCWG